MAMGSPLSWPIGSPSIPSRTHKGVPSLASKMAPNPHPLAIQVRGPARDPVGTCHKPLMTRLRATLKSDGPLVMLWSHQGIVGVMLLEELSPARLLEGVSC